MCYIQFKLFCVVFLRSVRLSPVSFAVFWVTERTLTSVRGRYNISSGFSSVHCGNWWWLTSYVPDW